MCQILAPLAKRICLVPVPSERTAAPADLERECAEAHPEAETRAFASLEEALAALAGVPLVLITGSLYLVGEALERLRITAGPVRSERDLNERLVGP